MNPEAILYQAEGMIATEPGVAHSERGWAANLDLGFAPRDGRTVLVERRQRGPLAVQRPFYPEAGVCHVYLLHPPGGIAGGDRLDIGVRVAPNAHALVTTPGATKFYRSLGPWARVRQRVQVAAGATLEWLPQEGIFFPGACVDLATEMELSGDARLFAWEVQTLGRPALGERFAHGQASLGLSLSRDGRPVLRERLRLDGPASLNGPSTLRGQPICGTLLAGPAGPADLAAARRLVAKSPLAICGMTLIDEILVARCLAERLEPVQRHFRQLWEELRPRLLGMPTCPPRIWAT